MKNKKFIVTDNQETANQLLKHNLKLINSINGKWFFINEPTKLTFGELKKVVYTDKLFI